MTTQRPNTQRALRAQGRADLYFTLYASLGPERTLARVSAIAGAAGVPVHSHTLESYAKRFDWKERARAFDAQHAQQAAQVTLDQAISSTVQQSQLGRALQGLAVKGLNERMQAARSDLSGSEIARLAAEGVKIERLASGEATEIRHVAVRFYGLVVHDLAEVWRDSIAEAMRVVAVDDDLRQRAIDAAAAVFAPAADRVLQHHLASMGMHDVVVTSTDGGEEYPE